MSSCNPNYTLQAILQQMSDEELETYCVAHRSLTSQELVEELVYRWKRERSMHSDVQHT